MPIIDIPDSLEFTVTDALAALEREVNRQQQDVRREIVAQLQAAVEGIARPNVVSDDDLPAAINAVRDTLVELRRQFVRLGRVEADMARQREALP